MMLEAFGVLLVLIIIVVVVAIIVHIIRQRQKGGNWYSEIQAIAANVENEQFVQAEPAAGPLQVVQTRGGDAAIAEADRIWWELKQQAILGQSEKTADGRDKIENFDGSDVVEPLSQTDQDYVNKLKIKLNTLITDQIASPIAGTTSSRWQQIRDEGKMQNVQSLSLIEQYVQRQFAYTKGKGDLTKLCFKDKQGYVDVDVNFYVLVHELTHAYDIRFQLGQSHDEYFWILFSKLIMRSIKLGLLNPDVFKHNQKRCGTEVLKVDHFDVIKGYYGKVLPQRTEHYRPMYLGNGSV